MTESEALGAILLVGSHSVYLEVAAEILKLARYTTIRASSAKQAQELIVKQLPDLILLDVPLPDTADGGRAQAGDHHGTIEVSHQPDAVEAVSAKPWLDR